MCLSPDDDNERVFWLYTDVPDRATYLFVHLNVESIGHLVVLSNRRKNATKLALNIALITQFYLCPEWQNTAPLKSVLYITKTS